MNESNNLQTSFADLLNLSSVGEIESQLNAFTKKKFSKKNYQHKLGAYVRLSPSVDDPRDEGSLKNHPLHIFNYVERKNADKSTWGGIKEWYVDSEVSAATLERPAFQRMLRDMDLGKINSFVVYDLLRASRDVGDFSLVLGFLKKRHIRFFSTCDPIDLETPFGRFMAQMKIANGQLERETNIYRLKKGAIARAERGLSHNCPTLGYDPVPYKKHHIRINEKEAAEVLHHFKLFLDPEIKSVNQWINRLNEKGFTTKKYLNKNGDSKGGNRWTLTTAKHFLKNKIYIGIREYNKKNRDKDQTRLPEQERYLCTQGNWEAILSHDIFKAVQDKLVLNKKTRRQYKRHFPLSGLIQCSECRRFLVGVSGTGRGGNIHYYYGHERKMTTKDDHHKQRCKVERVRALELEEEVIHELKNLSQDRKLLHALAQKMQKNRSQNVKELASLMGSREQERRKIESTQQNTLDAVGNATDKAVQKVLLQRLERDTKKIRRLEDEIGELKAEIESGRQSMIDLSGVFGVLKDFRRGFDKLSSTDKAAILSKVIRRIVLGPEQVIMEIFGAEVELEPKEKMTPNPSGGVGGQAVMGSCMGLNGRSDWI